MKPRTLLITIIAVIVIIIIVIVVASFFHGNGNASPATTTTSPNPGQSGQEITIAQAYPNAATGTTLSIGTSQGTVHVNNFYNFGSGVTDGGVIIIKATSTYWFTYDPLTSEFWIAISGTPFNTLQLVAEQDFLATLGVSEADACKLSVSEGVPYSPGNSLDGQSFPLSFCPATSGQ